MTPEQFYAETLGKVIDYDGAYGAQCVDAFRYWGTMNSVPVPPTPNNWADGYWYSRDELGFSRWFTYITDGRFKNGDWVIWARGSSHPSSHIAMYYNGKEYGENQGGNGGFTLKDTVFSDVLGALRWKGYETMKIERGYHELTWNGIKVNAIRATYASGYRLHLLSAGDAYALKDLMEFDSDKLGIVGCVNANYFEMATGLHLGVEGDGYVDGYFQAPKQAGVLAYYINDKGVIGAHDESDFWLGQGEIQVACAPYAVLIHDGKTTDLHSTAFDNKDLVRNAQTAVMRIDEDWTLAIFSECYPSDVLKLAQEVGANELALMDSGGSTQMFECATTGKRRQIRHTSRLLPNVLVLAKEIEAQEPVSVPNTGDSNNDEEQATTSPDKPETGQNEADDGIKGLLGMDNRTYDLLKWICLVVIPALCGMLTTLADQFGSKQILTVVGILTAVATFVGTILGFSSIVYARKKAGQ